MDGNYCLVLGGSRDDKARSWRSGGLGALRLKTQRSCAGAEPARKISEHVKQLSMPNEREIGKAPRVGEFDAPRM